MTTTENNVAAQAGDEPMLTDDQVANGVRAFINAGKRDADLAGAIRAAITEALACQVSPRATADVERDAARYRWLRERPYSDWKRIAFNTMDDHPFAIRCRDEEIDAAIATTKPGA